MQQVDEYLENVIKLGDEGSALLAKICAPTLKNSGFCCGVSAGGGGIDIGFFLLSPTEKNSGFCCGVSVFFCERFDAESFLLFLDSI